MKWDDPPTPHQSSVDINGVYLTTRLNKTTSSCCGDFSCVAVATPVLSPCHLAFLSAGDGKAWTLTTHPQLHSITEGIT